MLYLIQHLFINHGSPPPPGNNSNFLHSKITNALNSLPLLANLNIPRTLKEKFSGSGQATIRCMCLKILVEYKDSFNTVYSILQAYSTHLKSIPTATIRIWMVAHLCDTFSLSLDPS